MVQRQSTFSVGEKNEKRRCCQIACFDHPRSFNFIIRADTKTRQTWDFGSVRERSVLPEGGPLYPLSLPSVSTPPPERYSYSSCTRSVLTINCRNSINDPTRPGHTWMPLKNIDLVTFCWRNFSKSVNLGEIDKITKEFYSKHREKKSVDKNENSDPPNLIINHPRSFNFHS